MEKHDTLVVLGNGPSLRGFDFARLRRFDVIGMNAAYRYWDKIGWYPTYYICLDTVVGVSHKEEISRLIRESGRNRIKVFVLRRNLIELLPDDVREKAVILDFDALKDTLPLLRSTPLITTGSHAALVGAMFGYRHMVLMGVDCNYVERIEGSVQHEGAAARKRRKKNNVLEIEKTPEENPNYFFDGYQRSGDKYHLPNPCPDLHVNSWRAAGEVLSKHQIEVWNGSPNSRVDVFPFRDFSDLEQRASRVRQWWLSIPRWKTMLSRNVRRAAS